MRSILLHNHIFKNAGTTLDWALEKSFGRGFFDHREDAEMMRGGMPFLETLIKRSGHVNALASHHMPFDPSYVSKYFLFSHLFLLRDFIRRALSVYRYERSQPASASAGAQVAKTRSMQSYFRWYLDDDNSPTVMRNHQTRHLCSMWDHKRAVNEQEFKSALQNTKLDWIHVGLVERFDESMVVFEYKLRERFPGIDLAYVKQNDSEFKKNDVATYLRKSLGDQLFDRLLHENEYDARLYKFADLALQAQIAQIQDFEARLAAFKSRCMALRLAIEKNLFLLRTVTAELPE